MTDARPARASVRLIGLIVLLAVQGCAHIPPSPLPESLQQQLGKIGVVATTTEGHQAFSSPGRGRLSNVWRGARSYAGEWDYRFNQTFFGDPGGRPTGMEALVLVPAYLLGATTFPVVGALHGAVASESWSEAETTFRTIVAELDLNQVLPRHLIAFAQAHGYALTNLSTVLQAGAQQESRYAAAKNNGIDTVLEIQDLTVNLTPAEYRVNPHRRLTLSARVQLIRTVDQTILDDRVITNKFGPALLRDGWTANHGARFRQEGQEATQRLAEQIITEYFMLYPFRERVDYSSPFLDVHLKGLNRHYPVEYPEQHIPLREKDIRAEFPIPTEFDIMVQSRVDSLQPTMSWEPFPAANVTYDLKIWRAEPWRSDALVYSRTNLDQATHKLETALEPSTPYYWSVRAHFSEQGRDRITEWTRRSVTYNLMAKVLTLGILAVMPDPVAEGFFVFITPPPPSP